MCTIMTISSKFFNDNENSVTTLIYTDNVRNDDGMALLCMGDDENKDILIKSFDCSLIMSIIQKFCSEQPLGRIFLHQRAATTQHVGVTYCHGFDDRRGTYYMHNGIISNDGRKAVDSFNLITMGDNVTNVFNKLNKLGENFANVLVVNTTSKKYGVIKMLCGNLHTDKEGNFSTNAVGNIKFVITPSYHKEFSIYRKPSERFNYENWFNDESNFGAWYSSQNDNYRYNQVNTQSKLIPITRNKFKHPVIVHK